MAVGVGMGHTVVGVLVGMGMLVAVVMMTATYMIVIKMHSKNSFFFYYSKDVKSQFIERFEF